MLGEATLLHPDDIRSYQGAGSSVSRKSSVQNDVVALAMIREFSYLNA
jgi:hypothetical protein